MHDTKDQTILLPSPDWIHYYTGCYRLEYELRNDVFLMLYGGYRPQEGGGEVRVKLGCILGGHIEPKDHHSEFLQTKLEQSKLLKELPIQWMDFQNAVVKRWFYFHASEGLVEEILLRLKTFVGNP